MNIRMRPAEQADCELLFRWVNDSQVRQSSFSAAPITTLQHKEWFSRKLESLDCIILIGLYDDEPFGQVRFDVEGESAEIDVSVEYRFRGRQLAPKLIAEACNSVFQKISSLENIYAHIKQDNRASLIAFDKAGFSEKRLVSYKGFSCFVMVLKRTTIAV